MISIDDLNDFQAAMEHFCATAPNASAQPSNVVSFADAKEARIRQGERARAYRVRPARGNEVLCRLRKRPKGSWYDSGSHANFVEIERVEDGRIAYCKTDDWKNTDEWACLAFVQWELERAFWQRFRELREGCDNFDYSEFTPAWDIIASPSCFDVFGWRVRYWLEKLPWGDVTDEEWDAHMAPVLEYLKTA